MEILEKLPPGVSLSTIGSTIGVVGGPPGVILGAAVGAIADTVLSFRSKKKARKRARRAFMAMIVKRYETQIFASTLERMSVAMLHLAELRVKPGTPQYEDLLKRLLYEDIGYKGNCSANILEPSKPGEKRKILAVVDRGRIMSYSTLDSSLGKKWDEACKELHKAALRAWAEDQAIDIEEARKKEKESAESQRKIITRALVNGGVILLLLGYSIRRKRKIKSRRGVS